MKINQNKIAAKQCSSLWENFCKVWPFALVVQRLKPCGNKTSFYFIPSAELQIFHNSDLSSNKRIKQITADMHSAIVQ